MHHSEDAIALAHIISAAGGRVEGAKKLQKLVYLAKQKGYEIGHQFTYHYHGVYSFDLETDLNSAEYSTLIRVHSMEGDRRDYSLENAGAINANLEDPGLKFVRELGSEEARTLEVLSTIVYLHSAGFSHKNLEAKLGELKGHIHQTFIERGWELQEKHFPYIK